METRKGKGSKQTSFVALLNKQVPINSSISFIFMDSGWQMCREEGQIEGMSDKHFITLGVFQECKAGSTIGNQQYDRFEA